MRIVTHDDRRDMLETLESAHRLLQHRVIGSECEQLLRMQLARKRPQPGTGAAGKNYGYEHGTDATPSYVTELRRLSDYVRCLRGSRRQRLAAADRVVGQAEAGDHSRVVKIA